MKKQLLLLLGVLIALPSLARDFTYTYEGKTIRYTVIDEDAKTCQTKAGVYEEDKSGNNVSGDLILPSEVYDGTTKYTLTSIGVMSFSSCLDLTSVTIPNSVTEICDLAFSCCSSLTSVAIPESVTKIGWVAFETCRSLTSVTIPNSVTEIDREAFYNCSGLTSVTIGNSVETIGSCAFYRCSNLTEVTIGNSVKTIGNSAFNFCPNLTSITSYAVTPPSCINNIVDDYSGITLYVPENAVEAYQNANIWRNFANIQAIAGSGDKELAAGDEFTYTYEGQTITYTVIDAEARTCQTKAGEWNNAGNNISGALILPSNPKVGNIEYTLVKIGDYAFYGCSSLTSVTIPNSVTKIGEEAFQECSGLTSVTIGNSVEMIGDMAFAYCSGLTSVTIPNSVTTILDYAFYDCSGLTSANIPNSVMYIGCYAFYGCSMTSVDISEYVSYLGDGAFSGCTSLKTINVAPGNSNYISVDGIVYSKDMSRLIQYPAGKEETKFTVPTSVTIIGDGAVCGCIGLTSVTIPNSVTYIGGLAFDGCSGLTSIMIPNSVTTIGGEAFSGCTGLTSITIPNSVTYIGGWAFEDCSGLTSITIPNSVNIIGSWAFSHCSGLTSITSNAVTPPTCDYNITDNYDITLYVPETAVEAYQNANIWRNFINIQGFEVSGESEEPFTAQIGELYYVLDPSDNTAIVTESQNYYEGLESVIIPETVEYKGISYTVTGIDHWAFYDCSSLSSVTLPNSVTTIGDRAFYYCSNLSSITLSNSVTKIGNFAFSNCIGLTSIILPNSITSIGEYAFSHCFGLTSVIIPYSVTQIGDFAFNSCSGLKEINVDSNNKNYSSIDGVFFNKDCTTLIHYPSSKPGSSYSIPSSVTYISTLAFQNSRLSSVIIPNSVTYIGAEAFRFSDLTSISITGSITEIGDAPFRSCYSLKEINVDSSNNYYTSIGGVLFNKDCTKLIQYPCGKTDAAYSIPYSVTSISQSAFESCELSSVTIPNSVKEIGVNAFYNCDDLTSIIIPNSVIIIGNSAFEWCTSLTSVTTPNSVSTIGNYAFCGCHSLISVSIGKSVATIGYYAFYDCPNLTSITSYAETPPNCNYEIVSDYDDITLYIPAEAVNAYQSAPYWSNFVNIVGFKEIVEATIDGLRYVLNPADRSAVVTYAEQNSLGNYEGRLSVVIPETVEYEGETYTVVGIGDEAFNYCWGLKAVSLPSTLETIGKLAFGYCTSLRSAAIPDGVTVIDDEAFTGCSALASVTIGNSVETIGDYAFFGCTGLATLQLPASVTTIGENAFMGIHWFTTVHANSATPAEAPASAFSFNAYQNAMLVVPDGALDNYQSHPTWSNFQTIREKSDLITSINEVEGAPDVTGPEVVKIYNTSGSQVYHGPSDRIDLPSGLYLMVTGTGTRKIKL